MSPRRLLAPGLLLLASACATPPPPRPDTPSTAQASPPAPTTPPEADTQEELPPSAMASVALRGELMTAAAGLKSHLGNHPTDAAAWTNLGIVHERLGRTEQAEHAYRKAVELQPELQAAWDNLTRLHCRTGRAPQVEAWLREQLQSTPEALAPRTALALALLAQDKREAAATEAKRVLKADERHVRAMQLLAQVYYRERKHELAKMVLENARALAPEEAATHHALGLVLLALGPRPAALESFQRATALRPDFAEARNNLGALLNEAQDHAAAARELEATVQAAPDFLDAHLNLGNAWRGLGDFARALAEYQQVLRLAPQLPDTYFNLALLHLDAEPPHLDTLVRLQTSISFFEQYLARGGQDPRVEEYLKDARKGLDREERRREREKRKQLREAQKAEESQKADTPAPETPGSGRVADDAPK